MMVSSSYTRAACQVAGGQVRYSQEPGAGALCLAAALQEAARALQAHRLGEPLPVSRERGKVKP